MDILLADGVTAPERLWGAMKLKNALFFNNDERMGFIEDVLEDEEAVEEIEVDAYVNKELVSELEKLYEKWGGESPGILPVWREYVDSFYHTRSESSEEESEEEEEVEEPKVGSAAWLVERKTNWRKRWQRWKTKAGRNLAQGKAPKARTKRGPTVKEIRARLSQVKMLTTGNKPVLLKRLALVEEVRRIVKENFSNKNEEGWSPRRFRTWVNEELQKTPFLMPEDERLGKEAFWLIVNKWHADTKDLPLDPSSSDSSSDSSSGLVGSVVAEAIPEATAWTHEHYAQHKQHFVKTMFRKAMSLVSRFAPRKMKFASKPASLQVAVAVPVASAIAKVANTRRIPRMDINLNAGAPLPVNDIMARG